MINPHRGEIEAVLNGETYTLCLTLGALASLEHALGVDDLAGLSTKFAKGSLKADELIAVIEAGLAGGGNEMKTLDVTTMQADGAIAGYVDIAARLLEATFIPRGETRPS